MEKGQVQAVLWLVCLSCTVTTVTSQVCEQTVDLTIIMDGSSDVTTANFGLIKNFMLDLVDAENMKISFSTTRVNFVQFASRVQASGNFLTSNRRCQTTLQDMNYMNEAGRDTAVVLNHLANNRPTNDRDANQNVALLLLTGASDDKDSAVAAAQALVAMDTDVLVIGVSDAVDMDEIKQLTSPPGVKGQNYFVLDDFAALNGMVATVARGLCDRDTPAPSTTSTTSTTVPTTSTTMSTVAPVPDTTTAPASIEPPTESPPRDSSEGSLDPVSVSVDQPDVTVPYTVLPTQTTSQRPATTTPAPQISRQIIIIALLLLLLLILLIILITYTVLCCCRHAVSCCHGNCEVAMESCCGDIHCTECGASCAAVVCSPCCRIQDKNSDEEASIKFSNIKTADEQETVQTPLNPAKT